MSITRFVIVILVFFGLLYYFQGPLKQLPQEFSSLHSPYVASFETTLNSILSATSSSVITGFENYIPGMEGSTSTASSSELNILGENNLSGDATPANNAGDATGTVSANSNSMYTNSLNQLPPVISDEGPGALSSTGIIDDTNAERAKVGTAPLAVNADLTASAEAKLQDMFQNQYFAHVSPSGENVANVVTREGYQYIVVGENLALGLFPSDASVVAAWMASPGHKRNILDPRYEDIGVAVGEGVYQGRQQWLIVQHFGKPLSACPSPSSDLKNTITNQTSDLSNLEQNISNSKADVDQATQGTDDYWTQVDAYNALVTQYNTEKDSLQNNLTTYNASVTAFNTCIGASSD